MAGIEEVAAHAQSHLTFGLLEAVMETKLSESILLSNNDGYTVLVDDHLPNLLADWRSRIRQLAQTDIDKCRQWAQRVEEALSAANRLLLLELTQPFSSRPYSLEIPFCNSTSKCRHRRSFDVLEASVPCVSSTGYFLVIHPWSRRPSSQRHDSKWLVPVRR
jgi:hypothetical protein